MESFQAQMRVCGWLIKKNLSDLWADLAACIRLNHCACVIVNE